MSPLVPLGVAVWALPFAGSLAASRARTAQEARTRGMLTGGATAAVALALLGRLVPGDLTMIEAHLRWGRWFDLHLGLDGLGAVLLALASGLLVVLLLGLPRAALDRRAVARLLFSQGAMLGCFVAMDALWFCAFWLLSLAPTLLDAWCERRTAPGRVMLATTALMTLPMVAATAGLGRVGARAGLASAFDLVALARHGHVPTWIGVATLVAVLARMGVVPLHLWLGPAFERGPTAALMSAFVMPVGSFALARLVWPVAPEVFRAASPGLVALGLATAVYGTLLAASQHDVRRLAAAFMVSQRGLLLVGLAALSPQSVAGALLHAVAEVFPVCGLALVGVLLVARTGVADARRLGGLVRRAPTMAATWLAFSAAAVGFPGTMAFISEDLLVQGLLRAHGVTAVALLVTSAVNGVTLYRAFARVFLGPYPDDPVAGEDFEDLLPHERWATGALILAAVLGGFLPGPMLAVRRSAVDALTPRAHAPAERPRAPVITPHQPPRRGAITRSTVISRS